MTALAQGERRIHDLFHNEVEGRRVDPKRIHELFVDDTANAEMDRILHHQEMGFWRRFWRKFVG